MWVTLQHQPLRVSFESLDLSFGDCDLWVRGRIEMTPNHIAIKKPRESKSQKAHCSDFCNREKRHCDCLTAIWTEGFNRSRPNRAIWKCYLSRRDSDLSEVLAIWALRFQKSVGALLFRFAICVMDFGHCTTFCCIKPWKCKPWIQESSASKICCDTQCLFTSN